MSKTSPAMLTRVAFITAVAVGTGNTQGDQDPPTLTAKQVVDILLPLEKEIRKARTDEEKQAASEAIIKAQHKVSNFFGPGAEFTITFEHGEKTYTAAIDLDQGMKRLTGKGVVVLMTPAMLEAMHEQVMTGATNFDPKLEAKMRATALTQYIPLDHKDAQGWFAHVFGPAGHNVSFDPIKAQIEEKATPFIQKKNEELAKQLSPTAPAPAPEK